MAKKRNSIVSEPFGNNLIRTYDSKGYYVMQNETGVKYAEAIDVHGVYTYSETNEKIPDEFGEN